jgi:hypothetical protein
MKADIQVTAEKIVKLRSELEYARYQEKLSADLAKGGAGPEEDAKKWSAQVAADNAAIKEAQAEEQRSRLKYQSEIDGVNTAVAATQAELDQALFYLDNTLMVAPEDGYIMNLQVRPGMVAGDIRFGAIASFICDENRYLLANFFQENLKFMKPGQPVEIALDLYPGQIWPARSRPSGREAGLDRCCRAERCRRSITSRPRSHRGTIRRGDHAGRSRSDQVSDRHAGARRDLHQSRQRFRHPAQDRDPRLHLVQLAVPVLRMMRAHFSSRRDARRLRAQGAADALPTSSIRRCRRTRASRPRGVPIRGRRVDNDWLKSFNDPC